MIYVPPYAVKMVRNQENKEIGNALLGLMVHMQALNNCFGSIKTR